jgi:hypothetical protein
VADGVNGLIRLLSKGEIKTTIVGTLVGNVAVKICPHALNKLATLLGLVAKRRPVYRPMLGPLVLLPATPVTEDPLGNGYIHVTVGWRAIDAASRIRTYALWERVNQGGWRRLILPTQTGAVLTYHALGQTVQYAIRAFDWAGNTSPWAYTLTYRL